MTTDLLTDEELIALDLTSKLANSMRVIIGDGPLAEYDWAEIAAKIHDIQHTIMAQAASRAYPEKFRLLGSKGTWTTTPEGKDDGC